MKTMILILAFISFNSWAGFVAGSKINQCDRVEYLENSLCQEKESETCYEQPQSSDCGVYKLKNLHSEISVNEESCIGEECVHLLPNKVCSLNHTAFINEDFTGVYCREIIGKELVVDPVLKAQHDLAKQQSEALKAALSTVKKLRECLIGVIDVLILRNASKNLTIPQVEEMVSTYQPIQDLLYAGSGATAKLKISLVTADGVLVTESDKTALTQEIDKCLGN